MSNSKFTGDYNDSVFYLAVSDMMEQEGRELEEKYKDAEDIAPSPEAAEKFEKALNKAYRNGQLRSFRTKAAKFVKYTVTVCAAFIVVFAVSVISVDAFRLRFLEWLVNIHGSHSSLNIFNDNDNKVYNMVHADYMVDGYILTNYNNDGEIIEIHYSNNVNYVQVRIYLNGFTFNTDNEDTLSEEVYINENKGQYQKKELTSTLLWYDNNNSYWISTNDTGISKDEIIKIAQSVN